MRPRLILSLLLVVAAGILCYWLVFKRPSAESASAQTPRDQAARTQAVPVVTAPVEQSNFPIRRRSIGLLESPAIVVIKSRIDSQMIEKHVEDGQLVRKGTLLFTLDDREIRATIARDEAQLAKDQAAQERAAADLKRTEELMSRNVAPRQQLDQMTAEFKAAEATVAADRAQLQTDQLKLNYTKIEAPIGGRLGTIRVTPGNIVSTADTAGLVTITQIRPIRVSFTLPERDLTALRAALRRDPSPAVRVFAHGNPTPLASGELNYVDSSVDSTTGTIGAKATFANLDFTLWPGQYVDVEVDLDIRPNTATIPTVALQTGQDGPFVFVVGNDERVELRNVDVGGGEGDRTAILSGVQPGERVVVEGQLRLANGARVRETKRAEVPIKNDKSDVSGTAPSQPPARGGAPK